MRKLSLCVIAGNVERYIDRFLDAFQPLADEIILVWAIGKQEPDGTLAIAEKQGCVTGEYFNAGHPSRREASTWTDDDEKCGWPHVDDFAAARNLAFSMASHDLIMWADTDDVITPESIAAIRDAIERMPEDCDGIEMPYKVPEDGVTVFRERIIRKGTAKWVSPIHEHLVFSDGAKLAKITNAEILHAPLGNRGANDERNLRILESIPFEDRTLSHRFHIFQSLRAVGRTGEAVAEAVALLSDPPEGMGTAERFELFICAGQLAPDLATRSNLILQALGTDPTRREGFGEMALCMVAMGNPSAALGYSTAMRSLRDPGKGDWNTRAKYYGWLGEHIHGMALRANGRIEEADALEQNHFIRSGAKISLLHATRGRVRMAAATRRKWLETAANPDAVEHIFALDIDDDESLPLTVHRHVFVTGEGGCVSAWNAAAGASSGQVLVQLSDDFAPFQGWDTAVLAAIGDTSKPRVLAVSDSNRTDDLLCMAILTRQRYKDQGYLFHPEFFSMFSDNWFSERAFMDDVVIDARGSITFEHLHPAFGKGEMDTTYARSNAPEKYAQGEKVLRLLRNGVSDTGIFCSELHETQYNSPHLAEWLKGNLNPSVHVHDLGCGNGFIVDELEAAGFNVTGYEGDPVNPGHIRHDLTQPLTVTPAQTVCIEVAEHIPAEHESAFIANLAASTAGGELCVISWAIPGQPGRGHVNCLIGQEVVNKMADAGFGFETEKTVDIRREVTDLHWLARTLLVFRKK